MRRTPRTTALASLLAALALAAAGCGGSDVASDEVPGAPPALTVPTDSELEAPAEEDADAETDPDASADETEDPATADPDAAIDPDAAVPETEEPVDPSGGAVAPETETAPDETAVDPAQPPAGSAPEQFESFCEQNAGAC